MLAYRVERLAEVLPCSAREAADVVARRETRWTRGRASPGPSTAWRPALAPH